MIDYKDIGSRIRAIRLERKMTQERLAEAVGVGVTHISHIALDCSADELLCMDVKNARPYLNSWLSELAADCNETEIRFISDMVVSMKVSLRRITED